MFRTVPLSIIRSFSLYTKMRAGSGRNQFRPDPARKLSANLYDIYHCCVYSEKFLIDDGQRNCPKHVELHSKNKFEKLMDLVGFIIRNYHDERSYERQIFSGICFPQNSACVSRPTM